MNYNLVQTTYFLIFIIIAVTAYIVTPVMYSSFTDASDLYAQSKINTIRGEMFFAQQKRGSFQYACYSGPIGILVQDLVAEYSRRIVCRTNTDDSEMIVYTQLRSGEYYCIDSAGFSSSTYREPGIEFTCKDF